MNNGNQALQPAKAQQVWGFVCNNSQSELIYINSHKEAQDVISEDFLCDCERDVFYKIIGENATTKISI